MDDVLPLLMHVFVEFIQFHGRLEVDGNGHLLPVVQGIHGLAAHHEAERAFQAAVGELDVSELALGFLAVDEESKLDVLQVVPVEQFAQFGERLDALDVLLELGIPGGQGSDLALLHLPIDGAAAERFPDFAREGALLGLVALRNEGGEGRVAGLHGVAQLLGPHVTVAGGTGARIGQAAGGDDEFRAGVFLRLDLGLGLELGLLPGIVARDAALLDDGLHRIQAEASRRLVHGLDLAAGNHFHPGEGAGAKQRVHDVTRHVALRECAVAALHNAAEAVCLQQVDQLFGGKVVPGRTDEIGVGAHVVGEIAPLLDVREVAAALAGDHHLAAGLGHLLQHGDRPSVFRLGQNLRSAQCRNQSGGPASDHNDVRFHRVLLNFRKITIILRISFTVLRGFPKKTVP